MNLPGPVQDLCDRFLSLAGLVTGLYLTGGIGFGEWVEGKSDVDFVATLAHRPSDGEVEQLREVHAQMATFSPIDFDGMHVLASDLASDPRQLPPVPVVLHHEFRVAHLDQLVAWHELAWHGVTVTGPKLSTLDIWTNKQVLHRRPRTTSTPTGGISPPSSPPRPQPSRWRSSTTPAAGPYSASPASTTCSSPAR
jgi:hypothetical protein